MRISPLFTALAAPAVLGLLAACAGGAPRTPEQYIERVLRHAPGEAQPSRVIAAELAFARMAREEGTWTAFRHFATKDAVMPSPDFVSVQQALKDRPDPAEPIVWEPDLVWSSCNGEFALSTGPATYPDGRKGRFATIWQRQKNGDYRWVLDQGFPLEAGYQAPEMISARVAECGTRQPVRQASDYQQDWPSGKSGDHSLLWETRIASDCSRSFRVMAYREGEMHEVFTGEQPAPAAPAGEQVGCQPR